MSTDAVVCAVIDATTGALVNMIVARPTDAAPEGCRLVEIPDGYYWDGSAVALIPAVADTEEAAGNAN